MRPSLCVGIETDSMRSPPSSPPSPSAAKRLLSVSRSLRPLLVPEGVRALALPPPPPLGRKAGRAALTSVNGRLRPFFGRNAAIAGEASGVVPLGCIQSSASTVCATIIAGDVVALPNPSKSPRERGVECGVTDSCGVGWERESVLGVDSRVPLRDAELAGVLRRALPSDEEICGEPCVSAPRARDDAVPMSASTMSRTFAFFFFFFFFFFFTDSTTTAVR